jgi:hypothetical protein
MIKLTLRSQVVEHSNSEESTGMNMILLGFIIDVEQLIQRDFKRIFHLKGSNEHIHL